MRLRLPLLLLALITFAGLRGTLSCSAAYIYVYIIYLSFFLRNLRMQSILKKEYMIRLAVQVNAVILHMA